MPLMGRSGTGLCRIDFFVIENMEDARVHLAKAALAGL